MKRIRIRRVLAATLCAGMLLTAVPVAASAETAAEAPAAAQEDEWEELSEVLSGIYGEWKNTNYTGLFNNQIPETALLGNGDIGITSGGDEESKTFYISKSDFWEYNGSPLPIGGVTIATPPVDGAEKAVSLAKGAAVTGCCQHENLSPDRATSGDWAADSGYEGWVSNVNKEHTHYIVIDMGEETTFDTVILRHDQAARPAEAENNTKGFTLSIANDAEGEFQTVFEETSNSAASSTVTLETAVSARYLKVTVTNPNQGNSGDSINNPRARIAQVEVYNSATQDLSKPESAAPTVTFYEKEDIQNAQIETTQSIGGQALQMKTYTAAGENLMVTELTSNGTAAVTLRATAWAKADNANRKVTSQLVDGMPVVTRSTKEQRGASSAVYTSVASVGLRVVGTEAVAAAAQDGGKAYIDFAVQPNETVYLVTAIGGGGKTYDNKGKLAGEQSPVDQAAALLSGVSDASAVAALYDAHLAWWKAFWLDSYILLDEADTSLQTIQKYYYAAQYFLGCMCNEDGVAPGLYGIWHTTDTPSWNGDYHLNYNFISTFYGLYSSGRVELVKCAVQQILDYVPQAQKNAQSVSELKRLNAAFVEHKIEKGDIDAQKGIEGGLLFPVGIGPYGMVLDSNYHNQGLNGTFSATMLINYYEYSLDEEFLKNSLYDFLKGCATFYEAWLEHDEETGKYTLYAGYNEGSWATDAAAELAMLKCTLTHLIKYSERLGLDAARRVKWQDMLVNLADQPTTTYNGKTVYALAVTEQLKTGQWVDMTNPVPGDGNIIPMESVEPAGVFGYYSSAEDLAIAKNTIDVFSTKGAWSQQNNFPKIFPIAVNVRYDAKTITTQLANVIRSQMKANLRISDNTHGAEKSGTTQAVNNMLLLEDQGVIKLFGAWQSNKSASFKRLCVAGGITVSAAYDGKRGEVTEASLTCAKDGAVTVASIWDDMRVLDEDGNEVVTTLGSAPNHEDEATYTFEGKAGATYTFVKGDASAKAALEEALANALTDLSAYTVESAAGYTAALEALKVVAEKDNATQEEILAAIDALNAAEQALEEKPEEPKLLGDVDVNEKVNTTDARLTLQYAAGRIDASALDTSVADVDGNSKVNTTDARLILQKAAGRIDKFPAEMK